MRIGLGLILISSVCLLVAGCQTRAERQATALVQAENDIVGEYKGCVSAKFNSPAYASIRQHSVLDTKDLSYEQINDKSYISDGDAELIKQNLRDGSPCTRNFFNSVTSKFPTFAVVFAHGLIDGQALKKSLIERSINWGQYNVSRIDLSAKLNAELQPYIRQIQNNLQADYDNEMAVRQRALQALADLDRSQQIVYASRPIITNCHTTGVWTSCVTN